MAKSPSALSIHSSVVGFIRHPSTLKDLAHETVLQGQPLSDLLRAAYDNIDADLWVDSSYDPSRLLERATLIGHYYQ